DIVDSSADGVEIGGHCCASRDHPAVILAAHGLRASRASSPLRTLEQPAGKGVIPTPGLLRIHCAASPAHSRVEWLRCFERDRRLLVGARAAPVKTPNQALPTFHRSLLFRFGAASVMKASS